MTRKPPDRALTVLFFAFAAVIAIFPILGLAGVIAMTSDVVWGLFGIAAAIALFGVFAPERLKRWIADVVGKLPP